jgi:hypothetical protein
MDAVPQLLREAAGSFVLPVFGRAEAAAEEKAPGEWVTVADRAAESFLAPRLAALVPGSVVVAEEMAAADPGVLSHLQSAADAWLLDPLDGTANFAAGTGPFAMMAALLRHGEAVASWILDPQTGRLAQAGTSSSTGGRSPGTTRPASCSPARQAAPPSAPTAPLPASPACPPRAARRPQPRHLPPGPLRPHPVTAADEAARMEAAAADINVRRHAVAEQFEWSSWRGSQKPSWPVVGMRA